jgi:hypothetical protein
MANIPNTAAQVFYTYEIRVNGKKVGMIEEFRPSTNRGHERLREIANNGGKIVEIVPGVSDYEITLSHIHLHRSSFLQALGYDIVDLQDIKDPIEIVEIAHAPDGTTDKVVYGKCWVQRADKTVSTKSTHIVESATVWPTEIRKGT